jgi:hypothetical protein
MIRNLRVRSQYSGLAARLSRGDPCANCVIIVAVTQAPGVRPAPKQRRPLYRFQLDAILAA